MSFTICRILKEGEIIEIQFQNEHWNNSKFDDKRNGDLDMLRLYRKRDNHLSGVPTMDNPMRPAKKSNWEAEDVPLRLYKRAGVRLYRKKDVRLY